MLQAEPISAQFPVSKFALGSEVGGRIGRLRFLTPRGLETSATSGTNFGPNLSFELFADHGISWSTPTVEGSFAKLVNGSQRD